MELEFLGTGAGSPSKERNVTSMALKLLAERNAVWLFDVGEATQHQILRTTIRPRKIEKIFITHLHGDHLFGLPGLLSSRSFQGDTGSLTVYGPVGLKEFVLTTLRISGTRLSYPIKFVELSQAGEIFSDDTFSVFCDVLDHNVKSFGYRVVEHDHPGELQMEKLTEYNIASGPIYGQLKAGKTVMLDDGTVLNGHDFIGQPKAGRIVTILGDTRKTKRAVNLAKNADILVHESTFADGEGKLARSYYHSTSAQAATVADEAQVKQLLLTHISARYAGKSANILEQQARQIFENVQVVNDFDIIKVEMPIKNG